MNRNPLKKNFLLPFLLVFLSLLLFVGNGWGIVRVFRGSLENLIVPVKRILYGVRLSGETSMGGEEKSAEKMTVLTNQLAVLKKENEAMKRLLGTPLPASWRFQVAQVIGLPTTSDLQIDKGSQEGLNNGMVVIIDNLFIGKIVWTGEHYSRVLLPTSLGAKVLGATRSSILDNSAGELKSRGILQGQGSKASLEKVLSDESLYEGDWVVTAGDEELPPNLLVGKVGRVYRKEGEIYQKAEVEPLLDPSKLETVFVVIAR